MLFLLKRRTNFYGSIADVCYIYIHKNIRHQSKKTSLKKIIKFVLLARPARSRLFVANNPSCNVILVIKLVVF